MSDGIKNLTIRDFEVLLDLYKFRTLTTDQIYNLYFTKNKSRDYLYRRMYLLKMEGYLGETKPIVGEGGKKKTSCYFLTDKAIQSLYEKGLIQEPVKQAKDIRVDGVRLLYMVDVNQVYVDLRNCNWVMKDSRKVKEIYSFNRRNLIQGLLKNPDGKKFALYVLSKDPEELTLKRLVSEIKGLRCTDIDNILILCKTEAGFSNFIKQYKKVEATMWHMNVQVMPYEIGLLVLKAIGDEVGKRQLYETFGSVYPIEKEFCSYIMRYHGEEVYVHELLSNSTLTKKQLFLYKPAEYLKHRKKMVVFAWNGHIPLWKKEFGPAYHYLEFVPVVRLDLENLLRKQI